METRVILINCPDQKGIVARVTGCLFQRGLNIVSNWEFVEAETTRFFMRTEVEGALGETDLVTELRGLLPAGSTVRLAANRKKRIVILATRESHCLGDLLIRCRFNEMNAVVQGVISNHAVLGSLVESFGHPFHHLSHENKSREEHEADVVRVLEPYAADYLVLAKYMRVLSADFVERFPHRIINIHHSFLPAFIGANPYQQAHDRGVKIIGATAHFVTAALDDGPIIAQDVVPVGHQHGPKQLARAGHNVEKIVLARALNLVLDDRVFVSGNKTVIFD